MYSQFKTIYRNSIFKKSVTYQISADDKTALKKTMAIRLMKKTEVVI